MSSASAQRAASAIAELGAQTAPWRQSAPAFAAALRAAVGFDCFALCQHDPLARMPAGGVADYDAVAAQHRRFWQIEMQAPDVNKLDRLACAATPVAVLSAATGGNLARSTRWAELLGPGGLGDELRAALVLDGHCWASLSVYRQRNSAPFTDHDAVTIAQLTAPIAAAARAAWTTRAPAAPPPPAPGTVLVSADGRTITATDNARQLCQQLDPIRGTDGSIIAALAARLTAPTPTGQPTTAVRSLARGIDGSWIQLDGTRLGTRVGAATIAVTVQPAAPRAVAELLSHAFALTRRERQVAALALTGANTTDIAAELFLSRHTVGDHIKSIFTKTGVHTRHELAQRLTGAA